MESLQWKRKRNGGIGDDEIEEENKVEEKREEAWKKGEMEGLRDGKEMKRGATDVKVIEEGRQEGNR